MLQEQIQWQFKVEKMAKNSKEDASHEDGTRETELWKADHVAIKELGSGMRQHGDEITQAGSATWSEFLFWGSVSSSTKSG